MEVIVPHGGEGNRGGGERPWSRRGMDGGGMGGGGQGGGEAGGGESEEGGETRGLGRGEVRGQKEEGLSRDFLIDWCTTFFFVDKLFIIVGNAVGQVLRCSFLGGTMRTLSDMNINTDRSVYMCSRSGSKRVEEERGRRQGAREAVE